MQTMMERIAEAEQQADRLLEEANTSARDRIAAAKEEAESSYSASQDFERAKTVEAKALAERRGEQIAAEILADVSKEIDAVRTASEAKIPDATAYLLERIAKL
ncbi:MAG: hypothetical protein IJP98_01425 [Clostridia bacterium]|nr:hypothetical protein [Clostridia bacterium]